MSTPRAARFVFLNRAGVINIGRHDMVKTSEEFDFVPGIIEMTKTLSENCFEIIITTNQSGVARGLFTEEELAVIHRRMLAEIEKRGGRILDIFCCPQHPEGKVAKYARVCDCRKPGPGMIRQATHKHGIDLSRSRAIGDTDQDIEAGKRAGYKTLRATKNRGLTRDELLTPISGGG